MVWVYGSSSVQTRVFVVQSEKVSANYIAEGAGSANRDDLRKNELKPRLFLLKLSSLKATSVMRVFFF